MLEWSGIQKKKPLQYIIKTFLTCASTQIFEKVFPNPTISVLQILKDSLTISLFRSHLSKNNDLQRIFCVNDIKACINYSEVATIKNLYTIVNTQRYGECSLLTFLSERNSSTLCSQLTVKPTWLSPHRNEFSNDGKWLKPWLQQSSAGEKR